MTPGHALRWACGGLLVVALSLAAAQPAPLPSRQSNSGASNTQRSNPNVIEPMAADLREEVQRIAVTVTGLDKRAETKTIPLTVFRPAGDGPFPLVIVNHGRAIGKARAQPVRQRYEVLARYLVSKGFAVIVPTRVGYGETYGDFDPEAAGGCAVMQLEPASIAASDQVLAALQHARSLPYVDATRWVAIGQSVGGLAVVAVAWRHPPGLVAAINFSGGAGGNPDRRPGDPCTPSQIETLWGGKAAQASVPMLWLYWENDKFWGAELPRRWAQAWTAGGGKLDFQMLPPSGDDGHGGMGRDMDHWVPLVEAYLAQRGFKPSGLVSRPPPSTYAALDDIARVPSSPDMREQAYGRFLAAKPPRAFAVGPTGASGWATGDWAMGRALGFCQARRGLPCKLYAVDDDVVWVP